mmetsp:Transcript_3589/g.7605  ORF Transcript_3589/g.7605 Transcript_3589/m.7605 type:complete len:120 (-) Transcript_3589:80-439(-)
MGAALGVKLKVGDIDGTFEGFCDGVADDEGRSVGSREGAWLSVGIDDGSELGRRDGVTVGEVVGVDVSIISLTGEVVGGEVESMMSPCVCGWPSTIVSKTQSVMNKRDIFDCPRIRRES